MFDTKAAIYRPDRGLRSYGLGRTAQTGKSTLKTTHILSFRKYKCVTLSKKISLKKRSKEMKSYKAVSLA